MKIRPCLAAFALCLFTTVASADVIMFEDFEDTTINYTPSVPDDLTDIVNRDYFGLIVDPGTSGLPGDVSYSNIQGVGFYGAQDTDSTNSGDVHVIELEFNINISNFENLQFSFYVAEDNATDGFEDWDTTSSVLVQYQIDGGGYVNLFGIESEIGSDGNQTNELAREDTDFDTIGDGAEITDVFTQFSKSIAGTGSVLDLRIRIEDLDTGDEDIAIDSVRVEGNNVIPEPGSLMILGAIAPLMLFQRRMRLSRK